MRLIIENGQSPYCISVAADAAGPERFAAEELRKYLQQSTGAVLPIVDEGGNTPAFLIGAIGMARLAELPSLSEDGYLMKTAGDDILLLGGSPRATLYAVYHFLERYLGCGWLAPGDESVPAHDSFRLDDIDEYEEPAFSFRSVVTFPFTVPQQLAEMDWLAKNRMNWSHPGINDPARWEEVDGVHTLIPEYARRGMRVIWGGHTFQTWLPTERYFAEHPEYFALIDGERRPQSTFRGSICVSNPDARREVAGNIVRFVRDNPGIDAVDLWVNDTKAWCACEHCAKMAGEPDYTRYPEVFYDKNESPRSRAYYRFCNEVARLVREQDPSIRLSPLAYFGTYEPADDVNPEPNLLIGFTMYVRQWEYPINSGEGNLNVAFEATARRWRTHTEALYIYEYYSLPALNPFIESLVTVEQLAGELQHYLACGIDKISSEGGGEIYWRPLVMYAYARLAWDPQRSYADIIADFCRRAYGDAAEVMQAFWYLHETRETLDEKRTKGLALLARAAGRTQDPPVRARITKLQDLLARPANWETVQQAGVNQDNATAI